MLAKYPTRLMAAILDFKLNRLHVADVEEELHEIFINSIPGFCKNTI